MMSRDPASYAKTDGRRHYLMAAKAIDLAAAGRTKRIKHELDRMTPTSDPIELAGVVLRLAEFINDQFTINFSNSDGVGG